MPVVLAVAEVSELAGVPSAAAAFLLFLVDFLAVVPVLAAEVSEVAGEAPAAAAFLLFLVDFLAVVSLAAEVSEVAGVASAEAVFLLFFVDFFAGAAEVSLAAALSPDAVASVAVFLLLFLLGGGLLLGRR